MYFGTAPPPKIRIANFSASPTKGRGKERALMRDPSPKLLRDLDLGLRKHCRAFADGLDPQGEGKALVSPEIARRGDMWDDACARGGPTT